MFIADYFDFYRNFWNIGETTGLIGGNPEWIIKKEEKIGCVFMKKINEFSKIKYFEETIINFAKYLKNSHSK